MKQEENSNKSAIDELKYIKGVGPKRAEALVENGITSINDLLYYIPFKYLDRRNICKVIDIRSRIDTGEEITVVGKILSTGVIGFGHTKRFIARLGDDSGVLECIWFGGVNYFIKIFEVDEYVAFSGIPTMFNNKPQLVHPDYDKITDEDDKNFLNTGAIIPRYRSTEELKRVGLDSRGFRRIMKNLISSDHFRIEENLSDEIIKRINLLPLSLAVSSAHFPKDQQLLEQAMWRLKFDELFYFQLMVGYRRRQIKIENKGITYNIKSTYARRLVDSLHFKLTNAQKNVIREITEDMSSTKSMNRLLQGDVGSGKTIVALLTMLIAIESGYQAALMVPTEILAEQHYYNISDLLKDLPVKVVWLIGGQKKKLRREILESIEDGSANLVVGTHALIEENVKFKNLGLVIIDEQHRFGVMQRATLREKGINADVLVMTATPIPRTLSLTLYGDLDVSLLNEMPKNRKPIKTFLVNESEIDKVYEFLRQQINKGFQIYIVYPLIEESEKLDLKAATEGYEHLQKEIFQEFKVGLIHSKLFAYEKEEIMQDFKDRKINILVATTVIEVGIDIPNANIMVIQNAERFGLSQLHQLRGRVGRGSEQSYSFLIAKNYLVSKSKKILTGEEQKRMQIAARRLKTMVDTTDGFKIAEVDLELRGPGDFFGTRQTGLPALEIADLSTDGEILEIARKESINLIDDDPALKKVQNLPIRKLFLKKHFKNVDLAKVG
jgi:ATP-dependent DNA helicase RecG